jgi:hypothetical protein
VSIYPKRASGSKLTASAATFYPIPREAASVEDDARLVHADLATKPDRDLILESACVLQAIAEHDPRRTGETGVPLRASSGDRLE